MLIDQSVYKNIYTLLPVTVVGLVRLCIFLNILSELYVNTKKKYKVKDIYIKFYGQKIKNATKSRSDAF